MKTTKLFLYTCICIVSTFISSCNNDDYEGPRFEFDTEGFCYLPSASFVSYADFQKGAVGYAWEIKEEMPINEEGEIYEEKYETLGGSTPAIFFTDDSIIQYSKTGKDMGFTTLSYNYSSEKSLLEIGSQVFFRILTISENELLIVSHTRNYYDGQKYNYNYTKYRRLTEKELQYYKDNYTKDLNQP